jgi:hypothetical protein
MGTTIWGQTYPAKTLDDAITIADSIGAGVLRFAGERYIRLEGEWYVF